MSWINGTTRKARLKTYQTLAEMKPDEWINHRGQRFLEEQKEGPRHDVVNYKVVRKKLKRLVKAGKLKRVTPTTYVKTSLWTDQDNIQS